MHYLIYREFLRIIDNKKFHYLKPDNQQANLLTTSDTKSNVFLSRALNGCIKCSICNGYLHKNSISIDHIVRRREGGSNNTENLQPTHPYCNTTFKQ
ncbi:HNH endonuclease [Spirobacillus cienkowskii]|uniref:HNH endonuclease n=1 Tax=Spirobacillus cienkowskii TaxID=495820 RepID=UPI003BAF7BC3